MGHNLSNPAAPTAAPPVPAAVTTPPAPASSQIRPRSPVADLPMKRRRKQGRSRKPRRDNRKSRLDPSYVADDERSNAHFEAYYRAQQIVPPGEFHALLATLATPLPTSFRITASGKSRDAILRTLRGEMVALFQGAREAAAKGETAGDGEKGVVKPPSELPWYPDGLAWTVSAPRQMLRRENVLAPFHKFLVSMNDIGAINRQEAVSMIPPLMLAVQPGQTVIDLCAAPGSKTAQILESASTAGREGGVPNLARDGLVVANDADIRRCWMLSHQLKRFASADLVVTHHDAQFFPKIMMFDRVLCDVPCTGDGTMRKAPDIWRRWTPDMGIGIHRLQRQILERGLDILKPGGRLVYSTCSMNPLENEAVVAHALRKYGGDVELADVSDVLPGLKRRAGLSRWKVKNNSEKVVVQSDGEKKGDEDEEAKESGGWFESFDEVPQRRRKKIVASLFPPSEEELASGRFPLERCMRLVPHDQDTGAFFVSVFVKKAEAKVHRKLQRLQEQENGMFCSNGDEGRDEAETGSKTGVKEARVEEAGSEGGRQAGTNGENKGKKGRGGTRLITDDPLVSLADLNGEMFSTITSFYGMDAEVARTSLMTRGSDAKTFKRVVGVSRKVRWLLRHSLGSRDGEAAGTAGGGRRGGLRVVNAGVRVLERTDRKDTTCPFRVIHEGLELMSEVMTRRVVRTRDVRTVRSMAEQDAVRFDSVQCAQLRDRLQALSSGSCVVELVGGPDGAEHVVEKVVGWKGRNNFGVVMPREQTAAMKLRLRPSQEGA